MVCAGSTLCVQVSQEDNQVAVKRLYSFEIMLFTMLFSYHRVILYLQEVHICTLKSILQSNIFIKKSFFPFAFLLS